MSRVVVVGGGISGLAAAHRLAELSRRGLSPQGTVPNLRVTLLEGSGRLGGVIETCAQDGFLLEAGPDAFLTDKPGAVDLCRRIGLEGELIGTNPEFRRSHIARNGRLVALPEEFALVAPIRWRALVNASGLSLPAKLRAACERWIPPARAACGEDESVAHFMRRRFGREILERIGWPLIGGIYAADLERLSVQAALPRYHDLELRYGSVTKGLQASLRENGADASPSRGPRYGLFLTLLGGMSRLVQALAAAMPEVELRTSARVVGLEQPVCPSTGSGRTETRPQWRIRLEGADSLDADQLCLALPPRAAAELLRPVSQELAERLLGLSSVSVATVSLAYRKEDVPRALDGFGFVVDGRKGEGLIGCTFSSVKFAGRAPEGSVLMRAFVGGALFPEAAEEDDAMLERLVRRHLKSVLGIGAAPGLVWIRRFKKAMPQYEVGHLQRLGAIEALAGRMPGLFLTGNGYRGVGVAGCVQQAEAAAERIFHRCRTA